MFSNVHSYVHKHICKSTHMWNFSFPSRKYIPLSFISNQGQRAAAVIIKIK